MEIEQDWESTIEFFRSNLHHNNEILDIVMPSTTYNYFSVHHLVINDENKNNFEIDYSIITKNKLKRQLKVLKSRIPKPEEEIK